MNQPAPTCITEGTTSLFVYGKKESSKGPAEKKSLPFYNPAMQLNRDLSIALLQWFVNRTDLKKPLTVLDGLSASGIRGIRMANEVEGSLFITCNDWSKPAYDLIKKNCALQNQSQIKATQENIHRLLAQNRYHYVDIDPFGSPVQFIDSAIRGLKKNGILACTATDTATLCGHYQKVCYRRYGAMSLHSPMMHEIGLRILIAFICKEAAKYDLGMTPILSYTTDHYMRVYLQMNKGIKNANNTIDQISTVSSSKIPFIKETKEKQIGPLYMGFIQSAQAIQHMRSIILQKSFGSKHQMLSLLNILEEESNAPAFFYTINSIASVLKTSAPSRKAFFKVLSDQGFFVSRTHINPTGFKTNASEKEILNAFKEAKNNKENH